MRTHTIDLTHFAEEWEESWIIERCNPATLQWEEFEKLQFTLDGSDLDTDFHVEERLEEITTEHDIRVGAYYRATNTVSKRVIM